MLDKQNLSSEKHILNQPTGLLCKISTLMIWLWRGYFTDAQIRCKLMSNHLFMFKFKRNCSDFYLLYEMLSSEISEPGSYLHRWWSCSEDKLYPWQPQNQKTSPTEWQILGAGVLKCPLPMLNNNNQQITSTSFVLLLSTYFILQWLAILKKKRSNQI